MIRNDVRFIKGYCTHAISFLLFRLKCSGGMQEVGAGGKLSKKFYKKDLIFFSEMTIIENSDYDQVIILR